MDLAAIYRKLCQLHSWLPMTFAPQWALPPVRVALIVTHRCNLRCDMCQVWQYAKEREPADHELETAEWFRVIDQTPRLALITFTGGEPFVRPDLPDLLRYAARRRRVHLVTNATRLTPDDVDWLIELSPKGIWGRGLLSLGISLEGPAEIHDRVVGMPGAFQRSLTALRCAAKAKQGRRFPLLDVKVVITSSTYQSLDHLYECCQEAGADLMSLQIDNRQPSAYGVERGGPDAHLRKPDPVTPILPADLIPALDALSERSRRSGMRVRFNPAMPLPEIARRYQNEFRMSQFDCDTAWTVLHVGPYGDVYPCFSYRMGNVRSQQLLSIWNGAPYRQFRRALHAAKIYPGCAGCCVMRYRGRDGGGL